MPWPGSNWLAQIRTIGKVIADEFDSHDALFQGWAGVEHDENGRHTTITATAVTTTGAVTGGTTGTFNGTVTADADGTPVTLGANGPTSEPAIEIKNGTVSDWQIYAISSRKLSIRDVLEAGDTAMLDIVRTGLSTYDMRPHSSAITLTLGTNSSGQRWAEVNTILLNVSSNAKCSVLGMTSELAPAQLTANVNDYAISTASRVLLTSNGAYDITGIIAGFTGQLLWVENNSTFSLTLKYNSGSSAVGNRFIAANNADVIIRPQGSVLLRYDSTFFWFVLGA